MLRSYAFSALLVALLLASASQEALAHKLIAARRVREDGTVLLQAFFPDGTPAQGVRVEVRRPDGSLFVTEQTDEQGKLVITPDGSPGQWTATFLGSMGHLTETKFNIGPAAPAQAAAIHAASESLIAKETIPWWNVLAGLGFILGLSAFLMCLKLRAQVRRLTS